MDAYQNHPQNFWHWFVPYNVVIKLAFLALLFVRGRRANVAALLAMILLFFVPYWHRLS